MIAEVGRQSVVSKRKFGMEGELEVVGSRATWRNCVQDVHEEGWQEKWERNLVPSDIG